MGPAAVAGGLVSPGCAVAFRATSAPYCRFHDSVGLQIPDRHGHPLSRVGEIRSAGPGLLALSLSAIQRPLGAARFEEADPSLGPARHEPMTIMPRQLHVAQISFFSDPQGRSPAQLLHAGPTRVDLAEAVCRFGVHVSV